jgi:hypothetical protein
MPKIVKVKRSNVAGSTPSVSYGELAWNSADAKLYAGNAANVAVLVNTPSVGGGGGSANIVEAATSAGFPATGSLGTLYIATDVSRVYRWDSSGVYVEAGTSGSGGVTLAPATSDTLGGIKVGSGLSISDGVLSATGAGVDTLLRSLLVPAAPTGVAATLGDAQATVSWTAPATQIIPVTGYSVRFSSTGGSTWGGPILTGTTATSATVSQLQNGTAYVFSVAGVNSIGTGNYSANSNSVTPGAGDPYWANVSLLMHFEGSSLSDSSANNFSLSLDNSTGSVATLTSSYSRFGTKSLNSGASSSFATPNSAAFGFGTGDFTVEFWFYYTGTYEYAYWIASPFVVSIEPYGVNGVWYGGANSANTFPTNQWVHVAVCRSSGVVSAYMGGVRQYTVGDTTDYGSSDALRYGRAGGYPLPAGYLDELRVTKGIARYAGATLTEPTAAFPDF